MSFDDWILALHVLSAFAFVGGLVVFWALVVIVRRTDTPAETLRLGPLSGLAGRVLGVGALGTLVFGVWLAFSYGGYDIWDGWIIAALVLWLVSMATGSRTNDAYAAGVRKAQELQRAGSEGPNAELLALNRTQRGLLLHTASTLVVLLILADMIWKPGA